MRDDDGLASLDLVSKATQQEVVHIVYVHGLTQCGLPASTIAEQLLKKEEMDARYQLYVLTYNQGIFSRRDRHRICVSLLDMLTDELSQTGEMTATRPNVVFVGHDVGGILVKHALVVAARHSHKHDNLFLHTSSVVFVSTPHRPISITHLSNAFVRLLELRKPHEADVELSYQNRELAHNLAHWTIAVNEAFAVFRASTLYLKCTVWSNLSQGREKDMIFNSFMANATVPLEVQITQDLPHVALPTGIARYLRSDDIRVTWNAGSGGPTNSRSWLPLTRDLDSDNGEASRLGLLDLAAHSAPQYPFHTSDILSNYLRASNISMASRRCVFHVPLGSSVRAWTEALYRLSGWTNARLVRLCFSFDSSDHKLGSIECMLSTFAALLISYAGRSETEIPGLGQLLASRESEGSYIGWNMDDLFNICIKVIFYLDKIRIHSVWVLGNLSPGIESRDWLLVRLQQVLDHHDLNFTVLLTAQEGYDWGEESLSSWSNPISDSAKAGVADGAYLKTAGERDPSIDESRAIRWVRQDSTCAYLPTLGLLAESKLAYEDIHYFEKLLQSCGEDLELRDMIVDYVQHSDARTDQRRLESIFPKDRAPVREDIFRHLLSSPVSSSEASQRALLLLAYSLRPLTIAELEDILSFDKEFDPYSSLTPLTPTSKHPLSIFMRVWGNMAQLKHPGLRDFIISGQVVSMPSAPEAHSAIAELCIRYVVHAFKGDGSSDMNQPRVCNVKWRYDLQEEEEEEEHPFLSYAAQHWPSHATSSAAGKHQFKTQLALYFVQDGGLMSDWSKKYWALSTSLNKKITSPGEALAILAWHGLEVLLAHALKAKSMSMTPSLKRAVLSAAAIKAEMSIFRSVLAKRVDDDEQSWDGVALASMLSGDDDIVADVIDAGITEKKRPFENIQILLDRASELGQTFAVKKLLGLAERADSGSALAHACSRDQADVDLVATLLEHERGRLNTDKVYVETILADACRFAQSGVLPMLLEAGGHATNTHANILDSLLITASECGRLTIIGGFLHTHARKLSPTHLYEAMLTLASRKKEEMCLVLLDHIRDFVDASEHVVVDSAKTALTNRLENLFVSLLRSTKQITCETYESLLELIVEWDCGETSLDRLISLPLSNGTEEQREDILGRILHIAARKRGRGELVRMLTARVDIAIAEKLNDDGDNVLYTAAWYSNHEAAKALLAAGADVTASSAYGWLPIHAAYNDLTLIDLFIEHGADVCSKTSTDATALSIAAQWGEIKAVKRLLQLMPKTADPSLLQHALHRAMEKGQLDCARLLIEHGADPRKSPTKGFAELKQALLDDRPDIVQLILQFNVSLEPPPDDATSHSIVRYALAMPEEDSLPLVKQVMRRGALVNSTDKNGYTALYQAVETGKLEAARFLMLSGADVNSNVESRGGAFLMGRYSASVTMLKLLEENGGNTAAVCKRVRGTALHAALFRRASEDKEAVVRYLVDEVGVSVSTVAPFWGSGPLSLCCLNGTLDAVRLLVGRGADILEADPMGRQPIHFALYNTKEIVLHLLERGARLFEAADMLGRNPLHIAVLSGRLDLVRFVIDAGDKAGRTLVDEEDDDGWSPLLWALRPCTRWQNHGRQETLEVVRELLSRGAKRDITGSDFLRSWTPQQYAEYNGLSRGVIEELGGKHDSSHRGRSESVDADSPPPRVGMIDSVDAYCDACLVSIIGIMYSCLDCDNGFCLCSKCNRAARKIHPEHELTPVGREYEGSLSSNAEDEAEEDQTV